MFKLWTNARADAMRLPLFVSAVMITRLLDFPLPAKGNANHEKMHITEVIMPALYGPHLLADFSCRFRFGVLATFADADRQLELNQKPAGMPQQAGTRHGMLI